MALIIAKLEGVTGKVKGGHLEIEISGKRLNDFKGMSIEDQLEYLNDEGDFIPDSLDYEYEDIKSITIHE